MHNCCILALYVLIVHFAQVVEGPVCWLTNIEQALARNEFPTLDLV